MAAPSRIDDLVQSVSLHVPRRLLFHGYILPFLIIYGVWVYYWLFVFGTEEHFEAGLIVLAVIGLLQILSCLFCHWSVHVQCFLTCRSVSINNYMLSVNVIHLPAVLCSRTLNAMLQLSTAQNNVVSLQHFQYFFILCSGFIYKIMCS